MKKNGFTLAEVLVTLGIIGILSAIMVPAVGNARPDKTKLLYLKTYDSLSEILNILVNDTTIYNPYYTLGDKDRTMVENSCQITAQGNKCSYQYYQVGYNIEKYPLLNFSEPMNTKFSDVDEGNYKLANLLRIALNGTGQACTTDTCTFTTKNNISWSVTPSAAGNTLLKPNPQSSPQAEFYNTVVANIDNNDFTFFILADGSVIPADVKGQAYIKYRKNPRFRNDDTTNLTQKLITDPGIKTTFSIGDANSSTPPDIEEVSRTEDGAAREETEETIIGSD